MKNEMCRWVTGLLLVGVMAFLPMMVGCNAQKKRDEVNRAKPGFNEAAGDGTKLKMERPVMPVGEMPQQ